VQAVAKLVGRILVNVLERRPDWVLDHDATS
jgi:hypothetical protein